MQLDNHNSDTMLNPVRM